MRNLKLFSSTLVVCIVLVVAESCVSHDIPPSTEIECDAAESISYKDDIKPIITSKCALPECHSGFNGVDRNWTDPEKFQDHALEARRRIQLPADDPQHMPRVGELSEEQIKKIVCWANQGAPINN